MNNTVTFKVSGNDVLSFMDQIKRKADDLTNNMIGNARTQADSSKEQLKLIEQQIKALERKAQLETQASKVEALRKRDAAVEKLEKEHADKTEGIYSNTGLKSGQRDRMLQRANEDLEARRGIIQGNYRDQLNAIKETERQSVLQTKLLRDNIETIKYTSNQELNQMRKGDEAVIDELDESASPMEKFARELSNERFEEEKSKGTKEGAGIKEIFGSILGVDNINRLLATGGRFASTQNGFDMIGTAGQGIGHVVGAILGGVIGSIIAPGGGTLMGAGLGGALGSTLGGGIGEFQQRRAMSAQDFLSARYRYEAQTQMGISEVPDQASIGVSASEYLSLLREIAVSSASAANATDQTNDILEMDKGLGISKETSEQILQIFRGTNKDLSQLVGGIMQRGKGNIFAGGDFTFLNEFLNKFTQLQTQMRQNTENVHSGSVFDIMRRFDSVGGAFSSRDPRSMGLISQINNSLVNPGSDSLKAYSFLALRQANPHMGIADLMMERERGLASPTYLKSMLQYVDQLGGDDQFKRMQISSMFGINQSAAKRIFENREALMSGQISQADLEELGYGAAGFRSAAESRTTPIERNMADIKNGLLGAWYESLDAMVDSFQAAMEAAFNGATIQMQNGQISFGGVIQNVTRRPATTQQQMMTSGSNSAYYYSPMTF